MTDINAKTNPVFDIPLDIWGIVASFLDKNELDVFKQVCQHFNWAGSQHIMLQPLYNRLRYLDETLPVVLPQEGALDFFKSSFKKVQTRQQEEVAYLIEGYRDLTEKKLKVNSSTTLIKNLEATDAILDDINFSIIKNKINRINNFNSNKNVLALSNLGITRLLLKSDGFIEEKHINLLSNMTVLLCNNNKLTSLNKKDLTACPKLAVISCATNKITSMNFEEYPEIKVLICESNQLTTLKISKELLALYCHNNQLATLHIPRKIASLKCNNNPLSALDLAGLMTLEEMPDITKKLEKCTGLTPSGNLEDTTKEFIEMETQLLFTQLSLNTTTAETKSAVIARLGERYTHENCLAHDVEYNEPINTNNTALAYAPFFVASSNSSPSSNAQKKSAREEAKTEIDTEATSVEQKKQEDQDKDKNGEPEAKKRKFD